MRNIKALFDIGNDTIKGVVFWEDEGRSVILVKQMELTHWLRKWKILDSEAFVNSINKVAESFIKKLWWDFIDEVFVSISHPDAQVQRIIEQKRVMNDEIQEDDVEHLSRVISDISNQNNFETIKIVPVYWVIDEVRKEKDPIGMKWKKLELVADVFMLPKNLYNSILESFDRIWLRVTDIIPNIIAASEIAIDYDHKDLWTVLIDIWKNQTSYVIYEEGYPLWYWVIPIWGEDITKDISIWMQIDIKEAEDLKRSYGTAVINKDKLPENSPIDILFLSDIINARYEEIFYKVNHHLKLLEKDGKMPWWVLLTWWWAKVPNVDLLAKDIFKLATFYGKDTQLDLWDLSSNIQFINILWAYVRSNKYVEWRKWNFKLNFDVVWSVGKFFKDLF